MVFKNPTREEVEAMSVEDIERLYPCVGIFASNGKKIPLNIEEELKKCRTNKEIDKIS